MMIQVCGSDISLHSVLISVSHRPAMFISAVMIWYRLIMTFRSLQSSVIVSMIHVHVVICSSWLIDGPQSVLREMMTCGYCVWLAVFSILPWWNRLFLTRSDIFHCLGISFYSFYTTKAYTRLFMIGCRVEVNSVAVLTIPREAHWLCRS